MLETVISQSGILELGLQAYSPLLGQIVNVGFGPAGILGLCLAGAGAGLYLLRSMRPELARDYDIFFSAIGLLCGGILFFNGWRLDPILMFGQVLMAGSAVFFGFESIRLRSIATDQAKRGTPRMDDDDPVYSTDRVYRAELDELEPFRDDRPPVRRIRGARDTSSRSEYSDSAYGDHSAYGNQGNYNDANYGPDRSDRSSRRSRNSRTSRLNASRPSSGGAGYGPSASHPDSGRIDSGWIDSGRIDSGRIDYDSQGQESSPLGYDSAGGRDPAERSRRRRPPSTRRGNDLRNPDSRNPNSDYPPLRRPADSARNRSYDDEPPATRSRPRATSSAQPETERGDDYVDYKPISRYSDSYSSDRSGSGGDYDDEWGAS